MPDFDEELNFLRKYHSEQRVHNAGYYRIVYFIIRVFLANLPMKAVS